MDLFLPVKRRCGDLRAFLKTVAEGLPAQLHKNGCERILKIINSEQSDQNNQEIDLRYSAIICTES